MQRIAENAPTESFNDAYHWIQGKRPSIFIRNQCAAKTNRGNVQTKLNDKWNNVPKITVLHIHRGEEQSNAKRTEEGHQNKQWQKY